jgi:hypothetical protein
MCSCQVASNKVKARAVSRVLLGFLMSFIKYCAKELLHNMELSFRPKSTSSCLIGMQTPCCHTVLFKMKGWEAHRGGGGGRQTLNVGDCIWEGGARMVQWFC